MSRLLPGRAQNLRVTADTALHARFRDITTILLGITRAGKRFRYAERKKCIVAHLLRQKKSPNSPIPAQNWNFKAN